MSETLPAVDEAEIKIALGARRGDWAQIAKESGVSHSWLSKFVNGRIDNPGVVTLRKVRSAMSANDEQA